jgi:hypothetical protein
MAVPVLVTSLDPSNDFSEVCETLVVSAHGCAIRSPMRVKAGIPVHFHTKDGRQMMARIIDCQPIGSKPDGWKLGAQLDEPDNFWGLNPCPEDWVHPRGLTSTQSMPQRVPDSRLHSQPAGPRSVAETADQQFSADRLQKMVAPLLQPLQTEVAALRDKLAQRENNRSRFEVSLSHIPPELEQELWGRLRQDLGQRALQLAREESERILGAANAAIERKISKTQDELQQHAAAELKSMEKRAQAVSDGIAGNVQHHFGGALQQFQNSVSEAETRLARQSEDLMQSLHHQLEEEHRAQRQDLQKLQASVAAEWSHIKAQFADVDSRLAKLNESARRLESDFEAHVAAVTGDVIGEAKAQLESTADGLLEQLTTRNAQTLAAQLDDACRRVKHLQNEIETSISELLQARISDNMQLFEQTMNDLAQQCVERWRLALAKQLNSVVTMLGHQLRIDVPPADE